MILFVDDNWLALDGWINRLEQSGQPVHRMSDADRALAWFKENHLDVEGAILDVMMPADGELIEESAQGTITGLALAKCLHKIQPELPIIFLTANSDAAALEKIRLFPKSTYLPKEAVRPNSFVQRVNELLGEAAGKQDTLVPAE